MPRALPWRHEQLRRGIRGRHLRLHQPLVRAQGEGVSIFRQSDAMHLGRTSCRYCPQPALPGGNVCADHAGEAGRLLAQPQRAGYRSAAYRAARRAAIQRARGRCEFCGGRLPRRPDGKIVCQTHHRDGDPRNNAAANLLVACSTCHDGARKPAG
jgi:5-methylcytosine-specific restriction endonuclease McrA